jgi:GAF domain-containing protein/HAMP domain-containing protein
MSHTTNPELKSSQLRNYLFIWSGRVKNIWGRIRTNLTLTIITFALIPMIIIGVVATTLERNEAHARSEETLGVVAALKENEVKSWIQEVDFSLSDEIENESKKGWMYYILMLDPNSVYFTRAYNSQVARFNSTISSRGIIEEFFILDRQGNVILSTNKSREGKNYASQDFFPNALSSPYLQSPTNDPSLSGISIIDAHPILSPREEVIGVLAGRANLDRLSEIMSEKTGISESIDIYLVGPTGALLTPTSFPEYETGKTLVHSEGFRYASQNRTGGAAEYSNYRDVPVIGAYLWLPELQSVLLAEQSQREAYQTSRRATNLTILTAIAATILAILAAVIISRNLTQPLTSLTQTAEKIAGGNLGLRAETNRQDEIGALAVAFNSMTAQLRNLIGNLEARIADRTRQLQSRNEQLLAAADVGRSVTTILDAQQLMQRVVDLIQQRFDLYYVGLFLVDEKREWAVLNAGTGRAGQAMRRRGHRLRIGEDSMIGWSVFHDQARIALEVGAEEVRLKDPVRAATSDLPDTRSEAAIPLRSRGQVLGAITIQSTKPGAFDREMIAVFQTMADQVAIALDNARLFSEAQQTIETAHQAYTELSHQAWLEKLRDRPLTFRRDTSGVTPLATTASGDGDSGLKIPIKIRDRVIGYINAQKRPPSVAEISAEKAQTLQDRPDWKPEEVNLLEAVVDQLGVALDSARLFEQTQYQAERERIVGEVSSRIRSSLDVQTIIQTAVREMRDALDLQDVEIRIGSGKEVTEEYSRDITDIQNNPGGG